MPADTSDAVRQRVWLRIERAFQSARAYPSTRELFQISPTPVVLAVSGGPDSMCLADATIAQAGELGLTPTIAHLDHDLRGDAGHADADFVRAFAVSRCVSSVIERADVAGRAAAERTSMEVAARRARYDFLARAARSAGASLIALAHQADDQAETVLLRLIRGTGIAGLRGMQSLSAHPSATDLWLIRPLLQVTRTEVMRYCEARQIQPRNDASNDTLEYTRNRVRHELLPLLEQFNPGIRAVLARLADTAATDVEIVEHATREAFATLLQGGPALDGTRPGLTLDRLMWQALPAGLQRATLRQAVSALCGDLTDLKAGAIEEARDVLNSSAPAGEIALRADIRINVAPDTFAVRVIGEW